MEHIKASELVNMNDIAKTHKFIDVEVLMSDESHAENRFGKIYVNGTEMFLHKDLAEIVVRAAEIAGERYGWKVRLMDGLRTYQAQELMLVAKERNGWPDHYVSSPGQGAHPRGMAIDIVPVDDNGRVDMGTEFDHFGVEANRDFTDLPEEVLANREKLNEVMLEAAKELDRDIHLFDSEWWDFRFFEDIYGKYAAITDDDLQEMGLPRQTEK